MELLNVRRLTLVLLGLIVGGAAVILANTGPAYVRNCEVGATSSGGVLFQADVLSRTSNAVRDVSIIVDTGDGDALYVVPGPFVRGVWQHRQLIESARSARLDPIRMSAHFSAINTCFPQAITFVDGSVKVLYSPL